MFDVGGGELIVIGIVALIVVGPKELPGLLRAGGAAMNKVRRMAGEFRAQFDEAMREAEVDQAKKAFTEMNDAAQSAKPAFNPLDTIRNEIQTAKDELKGVTHSKDAAASAPAAEIKLDPPPPQDPVNLVPQQPETATEETPSKPKRTRKAKSDDAGAV